MGVVRDVTIDQLTQAVQGISSAGMTDTTGQDIKDAIDALDMTAGTLGKDSSLQAINTTLQSISVAISPSSSQTTTGTNGGTVRKWGNIVSINFQGTTGTNIGSVPSGYRPQSAAERTIVYVEKYNGSIITNRYYALLAVESNGDIACSYVSSYGGTSFASAKDANHKIYGIITYIV